MTKILILPLSDLTSQPFPFASVDSPRIWANLEFLLKSLNGSVNFVTQLLVELPSISIYLTVMAHELFVTHKFANKMWSGEQGNIPCETNQRTQKAPFGRERCLFGVICTIQMKTTTENNSILQLQKNERNYSNKQYSTHNKEIKTDGSENASHMFVTSWKNN